MKKVKRIDTHVPWRFAILYAIIGALVDDFSLCAFLFIMHAIGSATVVEEDAK